MGSAIVVAAILGAMALAAPAKALLGPRHLALEPQTQCRAVIPAYLMAMLLLALVSFLYKAEEKWWISRDRISRIEPGVPYWSRIDYEAAKQTRAKLLEILDEAR